MDEVYSFESLFDSKHLEEKVAKIEEIKRIKISHANTKNNHNNHGGKTFYFKTF